VADLLHSTGCDLTHFRYFMYIKLNINQIKKVNCLTLPLKSVAIPPSSSNCPPESAHTCEEVGL
jgi:hypothetical protein